MRNREEAKRIDEELVSADCLAQCLKYRCGCAEVHVHREHDDPPDFWINVDGETYAAEVTSVVTGEDYRATCRKLEKAIREAASEQEVLNGRYALLVTRRPLLPTKSSAEWRDVVSQATSFVGATWCDESTEECVLLKDARGRVGIRKVSAKGVTVGLLGSTAAKWEGEIHNELRELIQDAITKKHSKLEKRGVPAKCPRIILVLYDAYGYGDPDDAQQALLGTEGYDWFHSVFWAASFTDRANELSPENPGREGTFLYSKDERWWKGPTTGST